MRVAMTKLVDCDTAIQTSPCGHDVRIPHHLGLYDACTHCIGTRFWSPSDAQGTLGSEHAPLPHAFRAPMDSKPLQTDTAMIDFAGMHLNESCSSTARECHAWTTSIAKVDATNLQKARIISPDGVMRPHSTL